MKGVLFTVKVTNKIENQQMMNLFKELSTVVGAQFQERLNNFVTSHSCFTSSKYYHLNHWEHGCGVEWDYGTADIKTLSIYERGDFFFLSIQEDWDLIVKYAFSSVDPLEKIIEEITQELES